jgi:transposase InsO family protein
MRQRSSLIQSAHFVRQVLTAYRTQLTLIPAPNRMASSARQNCHNPECTLRTVDGEIFYTLREAQIVIESWRRHFNTIRPHASLGYKPPAPEVFVPAFAAWPAALRQPASPVTLAPRLVLN